MPGFEVMGKLEVFSVFSGSFLSLAVPSFFHINPQGEICKESVPFLQGIECRPYYIFIYFTVFPGNGCPFQFGLGQRLVMNPVICYRRVDYK